jgi:hypothetical protein
MMKPEQTVKEHELFAQLMPLAAPFELIYLPVPAFPMGEPESRRIGRFLDQFISQAAARWKLNSEVFLQLEQFHGGDCRLRYARHAREWMPEIGIGVWPDREPPTTWTREELMQLDVGERPRPLMYQVFWVSGPPSARESARNIMLDIGPVLQIMTVDDSDVLLRRGTQLFQSRIADPSLACYPFYIPLFERKILLAASAADLADWFCGATIYIRQSIEDQGILIVSREAFGILAPGTGCSTGGRRGGPVAYPVWRYVIGGLMIRAFSHIWYRQDGLTIHSRRDNNSLRPDQVIRSLRMPR